MQDHKLVVNRFKLQLRVVLGRLNIVKLKNCHQEAIDDRDRPSVAAELLGHLLEVKIPLHVDDGVEVVWSDYFVDAEDFKLEFKEVVWDFACLFFFSLKIGEFEHS